MKKALILSAIIGLAASPAFGQDLLREQYEADATQTRVSAQTSVYLSSSGLDSPATIALSEAIRKEFENSRPLDLVYITSDLVMHVVAPTTVELTEGPKGQVMSISYEIFVPRGSSLTYKTSCATSKVDDCARAVLLRAERFAKDNMPR